MAFFKIRKGGSDPVAATASPAESVEALRKRARQRLIGAAVLVLAGVIGFPLVFDSQPRPIAVDIPIEIPDRAKAAKPASAPAAVAGPVSGGQAVVVQPDALPALAVASAPPPSPSAPQPAPAFQPVTAPATPSTSPTSALATAPAAPASAPPPDRFVVQVGAFADPAKAAAARSKLERAGLKTYTHVAQTKDGKRIRVRVGPFDSRAEADKAASKARGLDLAAAVLTL